MKLSVEQIISATNGRMIAPGPGYVDGVSSDSRTIGPGKLFVPIVGENFDGHKFIEPSLERGATGFLFSTESLPDAEAEKLAVEHKSAAIEVEDTLRAFGELARFVRDAVPGLKVVAITGSTGKSTVKEMTASILSESMRVAKNEGNLNNLVGLPITLLALTDELDVAVVEMGTNQPGEIERLAYIARPDVAFVTNVGPVHLEGLGSIEGVAIEKGALPRSLDSYGTFVVNCDDPFVAGMAGNTNAKVVCCGLNDKTSVDCSEYVTAREVETGEEFSKMILVNGKGEIEIRINAPGIHNVLNAVAAAAIATVMGSSNEAIKQGIEKWRPMQMRTDVRKLAGGVTAIVDCYNSNPTSLKAALELLASFKGRHVAVIGDMLELGDYAREAHENAGKAAAEAGVEVLVAVGSWADTMAESFRNNAPDGTETISAGDAVEAAPFVIERLRQGDVLLVKASRMLHLETIIEEIENISENGETD